MRGFLRYVSFDRLEVTERLADRLAEGEGVVVFFQNGLKINDLVLVDDANEHRLLLVLVGADRRDLGCAVLERLENIRRDLVGVGSDDGEFAGRFGALDDVIADKTGNKAIQHAQANRLVVVHHRPARVLRGVNEEGNGRDDRVENEGHPKEIEPSFFLADVLGNDVGAARGCVHTEGRAVHKARQHAAEEYGKDGVVSVGVVLELLQPQFLQKQKDKRIGQAKDERPLGKGAIDEKIGHGTQRHVDQQRHITDAKAGLVLHHRGDTVEPRGSEAVVDDEQLVVEGHQNRHQHDAKVGQKLAADLIVLDALNGC